jgi:hypothetical protein
MARMPSTPARVHLPAGLYEIVDFLQGGTAYGVYAPYCQGLVGDGVDQTVVQIRPHTSTQGGQVPAQGSGGSNPLNLLRLAKGQCISTDLTLSGTDQGHLYGGFSLYMGNGSYLHNVKVTGIPGNWNSPPGETFAMNDYRSTNTTADHCEVDGYQWIWTSTNGVLSKVKGNRVGGSPFGGNASTGTLLTHSSFHDSYVSMVTASFSGSPTTGTPQTGWSTSYVDVDHNGNTGGGGLGSYGLNHEGVNSYIHHDHPTIVMDNGGEHIFIGNAQQNCPDVQITEPVWSGGPSYAHGCLVVIVPQNYAGAPNKQTTLPVVVKGGVTLTPADRGNGNTIDVSWADPAKNYVLTR